MPETITVTSPSTGAIVTVTHGDSDHGIWVTVNNDNAQTFISVTELMRMAENNRQWRVVVAD